jgi:hypothetical protein
LVKHELCKLQKKLDSGASKETKIGCGKGQRNTNKAKAVTTEQESM